jgi:predicted ATP-grasp superfamily ATP-dependent carboligase
MRILILDAANANSLAIVRYLGKDSSHDIDVLGYSHLSLSFFSKYANKKHIVSNPKLNKRSFLKDLVAILTKEKYDLLIPVGYYTHEVCVHNYTELKLFTQIILPSKEAFDLAANKITTYNLAEQIRVPYPKSWHCKSRSEVETLNVSFPAVIKASFEMGKNVVSYVNNKPALVNKFYEICDQNGFTDQNLPVIQEYIEGDGYGFFAYYENGVCKQFFMHKRIREYPASGGASVCAESIYDTVLCDLGKKLLDQLQWNGVAMVEFKKDVKDGIYKLMEINPKFWGSLELALSSGVNFPECLVMKAQGKIVSENKTYNFKRFHWILNGELFRLFTRPFSVFNFIKDCFTADSDLYVRDLLPNIFQIFLIFIHYFKKISGR